MGPSSDSAASRDEELRPGAALGNYLIEERIGRGSFATVYQGRHRLLERRVAIKVLRPDYFERPAIRERFRREAIAMGRIAHPNVVSVLDFGETDAGHAYLVMEWIRGRSLAGVFAQGAMPVERAAFLTRQIALGLAAAHGIGLVHRDLKPANVMLGAHEVVKIADFGLVRSIKDADAARLTRTGQLLGTPHYMSPELISGGEASASADLYALGVMLYEMIAGAVPLGGRNLVEVLDAQLNATPATPPHALGLGPLALSLLEKVPARRPASAEALIASIDALGVPAYAPRAEPEVEPKARPVAPISGGGTPSGPGAPTASYPRSPLELAEPPLAPSQLTPVTKRDREALFDPTLPPPLPTATVLRPEPLRRAPWWLVALGAQTVLLLVALIALRARAPEERELERPAPPITASARPAAVAAAVPPSTAPSPSPTSEPKTTAPRAAPAPKAPSPSPAESHAAPTPSAPASDLAATAAQVDARALALVARTRALGARLGDGPEAAALLDLRARIASERSRSDRPRALEALDALERELAALEAKAR